MPILPSWDLALHDDDDDDDLCGGGGGGPFYDTLLVSEGMGMVELLQEGLLDIHREAWDKDETPELHKALPPWLDSYLLGTGQVDMMEGEGWGSLLVEGQQDMQGCSQGDRQGLVAPKEEEDLKQIKEHFIFQNTSATKQGRSDYV